MATLFLRTIIIYAVVFAVVRLMGKRQLSDMQPFDLVVTLLIADIASVPISDVGIPLLYGIVPLLAIFLVHRLVSFLALKSDRARTLVCGSPVVVISKGVVQEDALKAANYTLADMLEQLRVKDVFSVSEVEYGILETNGSLSVLKKEEGRSPRPSVMLVVDGKVRKRALGSLGLDGRWLKKRLNSLGFSSPKELLFACLDDDGTLHAQERSFSPGAMPRVYYLKVEDADKAGF